MRDDGTWSIWFEGPPDLSTSIEAYVACRLAGVDPGPQALAYIQREGGIPKCRLFTKCFMALLGQWPWQRMAPIPPELVLLPPRIAVLDLRLLLLGAPDVRGARGRAVAAPRPADGRRPDGDRREAGTDEVAAATERSPPPCGRGRRALDPRAAGGGRLVGRDPAAVGVGDHRARRARPRARRPGRSARRSRAGGASWWMTASGSGPRRASRRSGTPGSRCWRFARAACPTTTRSSSEPASTSFREEVHVKGDWAIRRPISRPAAGPSSTRTTTTPTSTTRPSCRSPSTAWASARRTRSRRGLDWLVGMQSRGGGWGAFDVDNDARWLYKIPFCDFGKVTDEPTRRRHGAFAGSARDARRPPRGS